MSELETTIPEKTPRLWPRLRRRTRLLTRRAGFAYRTFMETPKEARITGFQFICFLAGLFFVSFWSVPVAGVIGAVIAIIAAERQ